GYTRLDMPGAPKASSDDARSKPAAARWSRDPRFDTRALAVGTAACGVLTAGIAVVAAWVTRSHASPDIGPTAAALSEGFAALAGAALGLVLGCAIAACAARTGSRLATGLLAGALGYALVLVVCAAAALAPAPQALAKGALQLCGSSGCAPLGPEGSAGPMIPLGVGTGARLAPVAPAPFYRIGFAEHGGTLAYWIPSAHV